MGSGLFEVLWLPARISNGPTNFKPRVSFSASMQNKTRNRKNEDFIQKHVGQLNLNAETKAKHLSNKVTKLTTWAVRAELLAEIPEVVKIFWHLKLVQSADLISLVRLNLS